MCVHGQDALFCDDCRKESRALSASKIKAGTHGYVVCAYRSNGVYDALNHLGGRVYKTRKAAQAYCDGIHEISGLNLVVRLVPIKPRKEAV